MLMMCSATPTRDVSTTSRVQRASANTSSAKDSSSSRAVAFSSSRDSGEATSTTSSVNSLVEVLEDRNSTLEAAASISKDSSSRNLRK